MSALQFCVIIADSIKVKVKPSTCIAPCMVYRLL